MSTASDAEQPARNRVATTGGVVEGTREPGSDVRVFRGVPFAEPPVGDLRLAPPRPARPWSGVRRADAFGPRPMQLPVFGDMSFRSDGMGEDCLRLNVWTPATSADDRLPVLVYLYGGGNMAGDGSEPRYDGAALARRGAVHSADIEYALGNLATNRVFAWTAEDFAISEVMQGCYANFVKTGDPNGEGVPAWPAANAPADAGGGAAVMRWDAASGAEPERGRDRYLFHDRVLPAR